MCQQQQKDQSKSANTFTRWQHMYMSAAKHWIYNTR